MKNSEEQAFPFRSVSHSETEDNNYGLTKREYFAIKCLQGLIAYPGKLEGNSQKNIDKMCQFAIELSDELLKQLETPKP